MSAKQDLSKIVDRIRKATKAAISQKALRPLGDFAVGLVVVRTRLGYGVDTVGGERSKLKPLSSTWKSARAFYADRGLLSGLTTVNRSNLTFTAQMLDSMQVVKAAAGSIVIGPRGYRVDPLSKGKSNEFVANAVAKGGRRFNNLSRLEIGQLTRFYRNTFGDLLRNERLAVVTRGS